MKSVFALFASFLIAVAAQADMQQPGQTAPDFTLPSASGNEVSLADYQGKWVVLEWINHGCPFVVKHYKSGNMQGLQKKYTDQDVVWLSICSSAPGTQGYMTAEEAAQSLKDHQAVPTAYLIDADGTVGKLYGAKTTPQMVVIDPQGKIVYHGAIDSIKSANPKDIEKADNYVANALDAGMAGEPISVAQSQPYGCSVKYK